MSKKKKAPPKSMEELMKKLEEKGIERKELTKEEFEKVLRKLTSKSKPKKPNN